LANIAKRAQIESQVYGWDEYSRLEFAQPILRSKAFARIKNISFLGILSPRYSQITRSSISMKRGDVHSHDAVDGTRACHSLGVARIMLAICESLELSERQKKYAVVWSLLHDIGNWPLSHTAQYSFSLFYGADTKKIREWMILDDKKIPETYRLSGVLREIDIDAGRLVNLFQKNPDKELEIISNLLQSQLTPDMLEGVWRAGRAFNTPTIMPDHFASAFYRDIFGSLVVNNYVKNSAVAFWKSKKLIYDRIFSADRVIRWESAWAAAVLQILNSKNSSFSEALELKEADIISEVVKGGLPKINALYRWKKPIRQTIKRPIPESLYLDTLGNVFVEKSFDMEQLDES
jgi:hypothetical protein